MTHLSPRQSQKQNAGYLGSILIGAEPDGNGPSSRSRRAEQLLGLDRGTRRKPYPRSITTRQSVGSDEPSDGARSRTPGGQPYGVHEWPAGCTIGESTQSPETNSDVVRRAREHPSRGSARRAPARILEHEMPHVRVLPAWISAHAHGWRTDSTRAGPVTTDPRPQAAPRQGTDGTGVRRPTRRTARRR